ncbi:MAG: SHOCT domain-containing protein [Methylococcaceae bacterium]|nr:SHOCT domain-containing protein [Methylococcaceae bacterium]
MPQLTPEGQQLINNLAQRYHFSPDAVSSLLQSVINGNGSMAQFNHPEFGGSGQWMRGGMIMLGDMFNNGLKNSVSGLCQELSQLIADQPGLVQTGNFQTQHQGSQQQGHYANATPPQTPANNPAVSLFVPATSNNWWPQGLQFPNSTGSQNNLRYAYFASIKRLAVEINGVVSLYDTLDHQIGGFSQQQSGSGSVTFTSQYGLVDLKTLPQIPLANTSTPAPLAPPNQHAPAAASEAEAIFSALEKLASLKDKGILTDDEYSTKKAELLARL